MDNSINPLWKYDNKINTFLKRVIIGLINPDYCRQKYGFDFPWWKKNSIWLPISYAIFQYFMVAFILIFAIGLLIPSVSAAQTMNSSVNVTGITDTTLTFEVFYKTDIRATGATFDGVSIDGFDLNHNVSYVAKDLQPNTTHTFCIYKDLINCETATTKQSTLNYILDTFGKWLMLIIVIILIFVGIKIPLFDIVAFIFALYPFLQSLQSGDLMFDIIWTCCLLAAMLTGYQGIKNKG